MRVTRSCSAELMHAAALTKPLSHPRIGACGCVCHAPALVADLAGGEREQSGRDDGGAAGVARHQVLRLLAVRVLLY